MLALTPTRGFEHNLLIYFIYFLITLNVCQRSSPSQMLSTGSRLKILRSKEASQVIIQRYLDKVETLRSSVLVFSIKNCAIIL